MTAKRTSYGILRNVNFRYLLLGRFSLNLALLMQTVVVGWQVYEIKKDPLYLGLIGLAEAIPALSMALFGGHVVDKGNPLRIYRSMVALAFLGACVLLLSGGGWVPFTPDARLWIIYGVMFASGIIRAFAWPAIFALTPRVVTRDWMAIAQTWMSVNFQIAAVSGPALGGIVYGWAGAKAAYGIIAGLLAINVLSTLGLKIEERRPKAREESSEPFLRNLTQGVRFVFGNQVMLGAMTLDMFAVLFGGATALLPVFAGEILMTGPESLGLLRGAPAIGALTMSLFLIHRPIGKGAGKLLLAVVAGFGLCMIAFGLSRSLWLSVLVLGISGALDAVSVVIRLTILQLATPDEMRGRVSAVNMIFIGSSNEIGEFESGLAAKLLGTVPAVVFGGCMTLLVVAATAVMAPKLRQADLERPPAPEPA